MQHLILRFYSLCFVLLTLTFQQGYAQISITQSDMLSLAGNAWMYYQTEDDSLTVDVGSPGTNQTWDLRAISYMDTQTVTISFASAASTPYASNFPMANLAAITTLGDSTSTATNYNYWQVNPNRLIILGNASEYTGAIDTVLYKTESDTAALLPLTYGSSWTNLSSDTVVLFPGFGYTEFDTSFSTVDGWGTVRLAAGDFPCLRIQELHSYRSQTISGGVVIDEEYEQYVGYIWITKDNYFVAGIDSRYGDSDPNFTISDSYFYLADASQVLSIADRIESSGIRMEPLYPNPVSAETHIAFELEKTTQVAIHLQNLQGQRVASVLQSTLPAGKHDLTWDVSHLPAGMYFCTLIANGVSQSQKIVIQ